MRKSQKILGQKKASREAAIWSGGERLVWRLSGKRGKGRILTDCGGQDDEPGPVVLDEFPHRALEGVGVGGLREDGRRIVAIVPLRTRRTGEGSRSGIMNV